MPEGVSSVEPMLTDGELGLREVELVLVFLELTVGGGFGFDMPRGVN